MAMKTREDALFNAYLNNYKAAQAQTVYKLPKPPGSAARPC